VMCSAVPVMCSAVPVMCSAVPVMCSAVCSQHLLPQQQCNMCVIMIMHMSAAASENVASTYIKITLQTAVYGGDTRSHQPLRVCPKSQQCCGSRKSVKVSLNISI
jgi:hypothetical protein